MGPRASQFENQIKALRKQHDELTTRYQALKLSIAEEPATATARAAELTKINAARAECAERLALLEDVQRGAADKDRVEQFERDRLDTIKAKDNAIRAAKARVELAKQMDAAFDTFAALLKKWEELTAEVRQHVRKVCERTPPPGRYQPVHARMDSVANAVQHSGATTGVSHRIYFSGLGRVGIPIDMILGAGFAGGYKEDTTVAGEATKGVEYLERRLERWLADAGTFTPTRDANSR